ncbi:TRNA pseudouridine synthase [Penicillium argentinense]|uniref:tRNA pseudouridine synthase 1 n=1 Tax=Penicillium argentinense TaxID=1131581 RepID=A0A9W9FMQ5_9EURO|nr:TRNA pseudouridine synthase [Penicillium argentinense]KAJ5103009.1 TRNA pseudouridine synthase [Penicillium argentinense]
MADNQGGGGRGRGRRQNRDMGRAAFSRQAIDKRERQERQNEAKRRKIENGEELTAPIYATQFSKEEIEGEARRPKKKAAILMGYSGTGYFGMQLNENQKTIEGDLFAALVAAGAISKANAEDPKKSSFVRCARTDKGVHAAGNVVSLKMIMEDPDIVDKINEKLSPQIRVWGIEQTTSGFSCYQLCDSRVYEYLMPSHCLLPPHPSTHLGRKIVELAEKTGELDVVKARQEEVAGFWEEVDKTYIKPILDGVPEDIRAIVEKALYWYDPAQGEIDPENASEAPAPAPEPENVEEPAQDQAADENKPFQMGPRQKLISDTTKAIKAAYIKARRAYRVPQARITRLQECLSRYEGTKNYHNYTIQKTFKDPSAKRHIKSFKVNPEPVVINGTEWLSLKVHGQSFMMHQIRKMVAMSTLVVRAGCTPDRINDSYGPERIAIPKAPGLGLLLERPIFENYNTKAVGLGREPINFDKYATAMNEFKQREIYDRIFREEEETAAFGNFFNHIDHFPQEFFLYVTSGGIEAAKLVAAPTADTESPKDSSRQKVDNSQKDVLAAVESEDEGTAPDAKEGN